MVQFFSSKSVLTRLQNFRDQFPRIGIDAFIVTFPPHVRYLSGFTGDNAVCLISPRSAVLVTDGRYADQVKQETNGWKIIIGGGSLIQELRTHRLVRPQWRIGIDGNTMVLAQFKQLKATLAHSRLVPKVEAVESLTGVKDAEEIGKIRRAVEISDAVFNDVLGMLKPGITEIDIAAEITFRHRKSGADGDAFEPIVASGPRGALPHAHPTPRKIRRGEFLTIDMGCIYQGYHSDMTRTVSIGSPNRDARKIYRIVLDAQVRAVDAARSGMKTSDLDAVARNHIRKNGYSQYFRHSLGHGVGLQIHESPRISMQSRSALAAGNVITIEPGIYIPNIGGVRIEDIVVIRENGCDVLTRSPKDLLIL